MKKTLAPIFLIALCAAALLCACNEQMETHEVDGRIRRAEKELAMAQRLLTEATNKTDEVLFTRRVELARKELSNAQSLAALDKEEKSFVSQRRTRVGYRLRETIAAIETDTNAPMREVQRENIEIRRLHTQRSVLEDRIQKARDMDKVDKLLVAQLEAEFRNNEAELFARTLERDMNELRLRLAHEANRIDTFQRQLELNPRPSVRLLVQKKQDLDSAHKTQEEVGLLRENLNAQIEEARMSHDLAAERKSFFVKEVEMLRDLISRPADKEERDEHKNLLRHSEQMQGLLDKRLKDIESQQSALEASLELVDKGGDLMGAEIAYRENDYLSLRKRFLHQITLPTCLVVGVLVFYWLLSRLILPLVVPRDNLFVARRLGGYLTFLVILIILIVFFLEDLKAIATVMGIVGAAIVIALQDLCSSFAGWFVIVSSRKVKVGDRVEIDGHRGDVIDIQMLRTTLLELNNWLECDEPTGRIIIVPNSFIFKNQVFNYSHIHPLIWGKVDITVTFETPAQEAHDVLLRVLTEETKEEFEGAERAGHLMIEKYGLVRQSYEPIIHSIIADSGVQYSLFYVTHYRRYSSTRDKINKRIIAEFESNPRLEFAYPTQRHIPTATAEGFKVQINPGPRG